MLNCYFFFNIIKLDIIEAECEAGYMANNNSFGVNQDKIPSVVNLIYKSCENLNSLKLSLDEIIEDFHIKYDSTFGNEFKSSLDDLSFKYSTVVSNILSYTEEFSKLSSLIDRESEEISLNIKKDINTFLADNYIEKYK